jgi:putative spermidine/putrescine transport system permease protein
MRSLGRACCTDRRHDDGRCGVGLSPALLLFGAVVVVPLVMTVLLSFHDWGQYKGIEPVFVLKNWHEVLTDSYFHEMFWRTFRIAFLVTLLTALFSAPEAYILNA